MKCQPQKSRSHHHIRNHEDDVLNEGELRPLARSLAPSVATLLDTNEKVLEDLMNSDMSWESNDDDNTNNNGKFSGKKKLKFTGGDISDDDSELLEGMDYDMNIMNNEWNGLTNAEQLLSDELGLVSVGFNFTTNKMMIIMIMMMAMKRVVMSTLRILILQIKMTVVTMVIQKETKNKMKQLKWKKRILLK